MYIKLNTHLCNVYDCVQGVIWMICGAQRYQVKTRQAGEVHHKYVVARSPAEARKTIRNKLGKDLEILSVRKQQRSS